MIDLKGGSFESMKMLKQPIPRGRISHSVFDDLFNLGRALTGVIDDQRIVARLEENFAAFIGREHCVAFPFARTAILEILRSLALPQGSVVILPPLTIKPILDVVYSLGLIPRFVDIDLKTVCFDETELRDALQENPRVAILTYLFGIIPDVDRIVDILRSDGIFIIEDFSQGLGAEFSDRPIGTFGDVSVYSASSVKTFDTYGGGLAVFDDPDLYSCLRQAQKRLGDPSRLVLQKKILLSLGRNVATSPVIFESLTFPILWVAQKINSSLLNRFTGARDTSPISVLPPEWSARYTSVQAGFGLRKLKTLRMKNQMRIDAIQEVLRNVPSLYRPLGGANSMNSFWQFVVYVNDFPTAKKHLIHHRIDCATTSLSLISELTDFGHSRSTPNARFLFANGVYVPCYHQLSMRQIARLIDALSEMNTKNC